MIRLDHFAIPGDSYVSAGSPSRFACLAYAAAPLAVWLIYYGAFFPGVVMQDSIDQWRQIATGRYDNWHPAFHTWLLWLLTRPWHSFGAVSLVQVVVTALLMGQLLSMIRRQGAPAWAVWASTLWLAASPVFGWNVIAVWKDTAFGMAVLWTTVLMLTVTRRGGITPREGLFIGLALAVVWLFRHNGFGIVLPVMTVLMWRYSRRTPSGVVVALLVWATCVWLVEGPLYHLEEVRQTPSALKEQHLISQVAGLLKAGTRTTNEERAFLEEMLPLATWQSAYDCVSGNRLLFHSGMRTDAIEERPWSLVTLWIRLASRNPHALLAHWTCATRFIWSLHSRLYIGPLLPDDSAVDPNELGIETKSLLPRAQRFLARVIDVTTSERSRLRAVVWQPAISLYLFLGSLAVALWRARSVAPLLVWLPGLSNTAVWLVLAHSPALRFQWPLVLLAPPLVSLAGADWKRISGATTAQGVHAISMVEANALPEELAPAEEFGLLPSLSDGSNTQFHT